MSNPTFLRIPINEWKRKAVHMGAFGFAFLLPYITPQQAALGAIAVFCFNAFLLPKLIPSIMRPDENGKPTGALEVILYPAAILATIVAYGISTDYFHDVVRVWFALAIGDGLIGISHLFFSHTTCLPWNARKNWLGMLAGFIFIVAIIFSITLYDTIRVTELTFDGLIGCFAEPSIPYAYFILLISMLLVAWESVWFGIADNLTVTIFATLFFGAGLLDPEGVEQQVHFNPGSHPFIAYAIPAIFAIGAFILKKVGLGGAVLGWVIATLLICTQPWLFVFLLGFFLFGVIATKFGLAKKAKNGIAEKNDGRRGPAEIFGAAGVMVWMIPLYHASLETPEALKIPLNALLIIISPLIAKTMDTVSSEIGKAVGGKTISLMNFKRVQPGTAGAVSLAGTLWGLAAAALLAALIFPLHWGGFAQWGILIGIAVAANLFESYWGAWAAPRGLDDGPHTNFLMTLFAAVLAWFVWGG